MKEDIKLLDVKNHLGCFGNFKITDVICRSCCVLNLRCAIERDQNAQLDFLEDLVYTDSTMMRLQ